MRKQEDVENRQKRVGIRGCEWPTLALAGNVDIKLVHACDPYTVQNLGTTQTHLLQSKQCINEKTQDE